MSNLGSCLGTAIAGTILVSGLTDSAYAAAITTLAAIGLIGFVAAALLPAFMLHRGLEGEGPGSAGERLGLFDLAAGGT